MDQGSQLPADKPRAMRRVVALIALLVSEFAVTPLPAHAESAAGSNEICPVFVGRVDKLDTAGTRYAVGFLTYGGSGTASGTVGLYAGNDRYDVPFKDVAVADPTDPGVRPQPFVVHFAQPVTITGAVVTALGATAASCSAPYMPWTENGRVAPYVGGENFFWHMRPPNPRPKPVEVIDEASLWKRFDEDAARSTPAEATSRVATPPCAEPNRSANLAEPTRANMPPFVPDRNYASVSSALVTIGPNGDLVSTTLIVSSHYAPLDQAVLNAAKRSTYTPGRFHCAAVAGSYVFQLAVYHI
jgi:hypothetical protein